MLAPRRDGVVDSIKQDERHESEDHTEERYPGLADAYLSFGIDGGDDQECGYHGRDAQEVDEEVKHQDIPSYELDEGDGFPDAAVGSCIASGRAAEASAGSVSARSVTARRVTKE